MVKICATSLAVMKIFVVVFSSILVICVTATDHNVGGATGWSLESNVQNWTETEDFYTGENLVFRYGPNHDVLEVDQGAFSTCETSRPIRTHNDGNTVISLDQRGTRYFICGTQGHCDQGLKIQVDILNSDDIANKRHSHHRPSPSSPKPSTPPMDITPGPPEPDIDPCQHPSSAMQSHIASSLFSLSLIGILFHFAVITQCSSSPIKYLVFPRIRSPREIRITQVTK